MTIFQSIILGIIEGATEFLPVSSTAHLIVAQKLMGLGTVNEFFTTVVQLGAIAGLVVAEWKQLQSIIIEFFEHLTQNKNIFSTRASKIILGTIPVLIVGFLVKDYIAGFQNSIPLIAFMSISIAIVLLVAEKYSKKFASSTKLSATSFQLFIMGMFQVISLIPGTSRSGITAAGGAFQKLSLSEALEWSFLLSIPALMAAGGYELLKSSKGGIDPSILIPTLVGAVVAFLSALLVVNWLRMVVRTKGFTPFVIYRVIFAIAILFFL